MSLRERAQKRVIKWKEKRLKGWEIAEFTGVDESVISRLFHGRGIVSDNNCQKVLDAKEVK